MTSYLLDTSVLSRLAPGRGDLSQSHVQWLRRENDGLFVPAIAIAEISEGIAKLRHSGASARADALAAWMESLVLGYGERVLAFDTLAARRAGELADAARATGRHPGFPDIAIAAIAEIRGMTIATNNLKPFQAIGVACLDPFAPDEAG